MVRRAACALVAAVAVLPFASSSRSPLRTRSSLRAARARAVMSAQTDWLEANGYTVEKSSGSGGSGWASFSRLSVVKPDGTPQDLFVKTASRSAKEMFEGEALGLRAMYDTHTVRVPEVVHYGDSPSGGSYMMMEYLDLRGSANPEEFGRLMGRMHLAEPTHEEARAGKFGFPVDNTIGGTPQLNPWAGEWVDFFRESRMDYQVQRAGSSELSRVWDQVKRDTDGLRALFEGAGPITPSIVHGDLWSGNYAATADGVPTIYDPACYYGHHEAEWGMSWCASFGPGFWKGYREVIPEAEGFQARRPLYQAYHIINHYNLFGGGYLHQGIGLLNQLA